ncbi:MAG: hypothetical protein V2J10_06965 [Wenzhouxiangella sp.]|jgi:hypothetical protein|nr:hypothetical protein [Wenzhouxiangella sp.]
MMVAASYRLVSTDLAIDAMLAAGYNLSPRSSLMLGYRRIDLDYDSLRTDLDLTFRGTGLALDIRF